MAGMTTRKSKRRLTEDEIDRIVTAQAENQSAWERPVHVKKPKTSSLTIPADLAARAAFLSRLHKLSGPEEWVTRIIRERIELEEVAFSEAQRDLSNKRTRKPRRRTAKHR